MAADAGATDGDGTDGAIDANDLEELSRGDPDVAASVLQDFVEACRADVTALERLGPCAPATLDEDGGRPAGDHPPAGPLTLMPR